MASLTVGQVVDIVTDDIGDLDSEEESDIEEDPSFPLPRASSSEDEDYETRQGITDGISIIKHAKIIHINSTFRIHCC